MGLDRYTTMQKPAGSSYAVGGVINAVSQFLGLDNKDGRALQWLGIAFVFLGFSIDRGKTFFKFLENHKTRPELRDAVREWKIDLSKLFKPEELKKLLKEIKKESADSPITNKEFIKLDAEMKRILGNKDEIIDAAVKKKHSEIEKINKNLSDKDKKKCEFSVS